MRPDRVSRYFARFCLGLAWFVPRSITSTAPAIRIFPDFTGSKKLLSARKGTSVWSTSTTPLQRLALRINHRSSELLSQQQSSLVRDAELVLELDCRHAIGVRCHVVRGPEPYCP